MPKPPTPKPSRDEKALLAAVVANLDDDLPRLVYADWLDEHGRPEQAEFIRLECEQGRIHDDRVVGPNYWNNPRFWELNERAGKLYDRHKKKWFGPLFEVFRGELRTHRGFPYHVAFSGKQFADVAADVFEAAPTIESVFIVRLGTTMPRVARSKALAHVRDLTFFETPFWRREAELLFRSPHLGNLRSFSIPFTDTSISSSGAWAISQSESLVQLRHLDIFNHDVRDLGVGYLASAERLHTLRELKLGHNRLSDVSAQHLADAGHLQNLTHLDLMSNEVTGDGVELLGRAPHLGRLQHLTLSRNPIAAAGARALTTTRFAPTLRTLHLAEANLDNDGLLSLFSAAFPALTELSLDGTEFSGEEPVIQLWGNKGFPNLAKVSLGRCWIGPEIAAVWSEVGTLPALRMLDLRANPLGSEGVEELLDGPLLRTVTDFDLDECRIGDDGAEAIAASPAVANVVSLDLSGNRLTNRGAFALAASPHLGSLKHIDVTRNRVGKKGAAALRERFGEHVSTD